MKTAKFSQRQSKGNVLQEEENYIQCTRKRIFFPQSGCDHQKRKEDDEKERGEEKIDAPWKTGVLCASL